MTLKSTFRATNGHHGMLFAALMTMGSPATDWSFLDISVCLFYNVYGGFLVCVCAACSLSYGKLDIGALEHWAQDGCFNRFSIPGRYQGCSQVLLKIDKQMWTGSSEGIASFPGRAELPVYGTNSERATVKCRD